VLCGWVLALAGKVFSLKKERSRPFSGTTPYYMVNKTSAYLSIGGADFEIS
jgi:hypothetical protein